MSLKKKDLHIVFFHADRTFIESGVYDPNDVVLCHLNDVLTMGPMCDSDSMESVEKRKVWLEKTFENDWLYIMSSSFGENWLK